MNETRLMNHAAMTADEYMRIAVKRIDALFGEEGYAKSHPELIAAFMQTSALDYLANYLGQIVSAKELTGLSPPEV